MEDFTIINDIPGSEIHIHCLSELPVLESATDDFHIIDNNVLESRHGSAPPVNYIGIPAEEEAKTLDTVYKVYDKMLENQTDKTCRVIGIGGGITCDIAGFVASTFKRGTRCSLVPTTLLSMVDAAIGGKNGVNHLLPSGSPDDKSVLIKNVVGTIRQPERIDIWPGFLASLPDREMRSGVAEIIKAGLIADPTILHDLSSQSHFMDFTPELRFSILEKAIRVKVGIVAMDPDEQGIRKFLNLGHTIGHAIESVSDYSHGEVVSIGIVKALKLSTKYRNWPKENTDQIVRLLKQYGLPIETDLPPGDYIPLIMQDKKRSGKNIDIVLLDSPGHPVIQSIPASTLERNIRSIAN